MLSSPIFFSDFEQKNNKQDLVSISKIVISKRQKKSQFDHFSPLMKYLVKLDPCSLYPLLPVLSNGLSLKTAENRARQVGFSPLVNVTKNNIYCNILMSVIIITMKC